MQRQPVSSVDSILPSSSVSRSRPSSAHPRGVMAQALKDVKTPDKPLVLKAQGSFFVGGEKVEQTAGELGRPRSRRPHHRQSDVRALHGAADWRRQRAGGDGARRDADGEVVGDDAGRANGMGRVLRSQGPSGLRARPGRSRAIGLQPGDSQRRARGLEATERVCRSGCGSATKTSGPTSASARRRASRSPTASSRSTAAGRTREAGCARHVSRNDIHIDDQGAVGARRCN